MERIIVKVWEGVKDPRNILKEGVLETLRGSFIFEDPAPIEIFDFLMEDSIIPLRVEKRGNRLIVEEFYWKVENLLVKDGQIWNKILAPMYSWSEIIENIRDDWNRLVPNICYTKAFHWSCHEGSRNMFGCLETPKEPYFILEEREVGKWIFESFWFATENFRASTYTSLYIVRDDQEVLLDNKTII